MKWILWTLGWTLWIRIWFHGSLSLGPITIPDRAWVHSLFILILVIMIFRNMGFRFRWPERNTIVIISFTTLVALAGLILHRPSLPYRGFRVAYFRVYPGEEERLILVDYDKKIYFRRDLYKPGYRFRVHWRGYLWVSQPIQLKVRLWVNGSAQGVVGLNRLRVRLREGVARVTRKVTLARGWHQVWLEYDNYGRPPEVRFEVCRPDCQEWKDIFIRPVDTVMERWLRWGRRAWWLTISTASLVGFWKSIPQISILLPLAVAWGIRHSLHGISPTYINSDFAVPYLMAIDILEKRGYISWKAPPPHQRSGRPTFYYGQAYQGTLLSHITAGLAGLLGRHPFMLLWAMDLAVIIYLFGLYTLTRALWGIRAALWAMWLGAIPPLPSIHVRAV